MVLNHLLRMMIKMGKDWTGNKECLFRVIGASLLMRGLYGRRDFVVIQS